MDKVKIRNIFRSRCLIALFVLWAFSSAAHAEERVALYRAQTLVADTSDATRAAAANQLLHEVLVRVSGSRRVLEHMPPEDFVDSLAFYTEQQAEADPELLMADYREHENFDLWQQLTNAQRWVSQYAYQSTRELIENEEGENVRAHRLDLEFDASAINALLEEMQAPVWDARRPKTLFMIALQGRQGRYLVTTSSNEALALRLQELMQERGVPLLLPENEQLLPSDLLADIWRGASNQVLEGVRALQPDAVVIGRIYPDSGSWATEWQLFTGLDRIRSKSANSTLGEALSEGVNFVAESLAERYASSPDQGAGHYRMAITNIHEVAHFAQVMDYLNDLSLTNSVELIRVQDQQILLELSLRGGMNQLRANLNLDGRLAEEAFYSLQHSRNNDESFSSAEPIRVDGWFRWQDQ